MEKVLEIVENICPHCNETLLMNKKSFANHVRWCKKNPRYEEIRNSTIEKNSINRVERKKHIIFCENCNKEFEICCTDTEFNNGEYRKTCSSKCATELRLSKTKSKQKCDKISKTLRERFSLYHEDYDIDKKAYKKICKNCGEFFYTIKKNQKCCSKKCSKELKHKNYIENQGLKKLYKEQCTFKFSLTDYPEFFKSNLIIENGWYKPTNHGNNLNGVSRDHIISINEGFKQNIDPYFISHPCNCQILLQKDNAKKHTKYDIKIDDLIQKIKIFDEKYGSYENKINYFGIETFKNKFL